ncbi:hypothetical protein V8G54_033870 [Vigna mungo]|uniref:Large ribosomal subunit protein uL2 C-terminal domain-containing protein n=1 Tax=Vigna mungo TaxID=3915 RepID=A0AAQ3RJ70_VIGMU
MEEEWRREEGLAVVDEKNILHGGDDEHGGEDLAPLAAAQAPAPTSVARQMVVGVRRRRDCSKRRLVATLRTVERERRKAVELRRRGRWCSGVVWRRSKEQWFGVVAKQRAERFHEIALREDLILLQQKFGFWEPEAANIMALRAELLQAKETTMEYLEASELHLENLPSLKKYSCRDIVEWPSLKNVNVNHCPNLRKFGLGRTKSVILENQASLADIFESWFTSNQAILVDLLPPMDNTLSELDELRLNGCHKLCYVASFKTPLEMKNLRKLFVRACTVWEEVLIDQKEESTSTDMPLGTTIHNIEITLGKGGQLARAASAVAKLIAKEGKSATLKLPSGEVRLISKNCSATVGQVGNVGVNQKNLGRAGSKCWLGKRPIARVVVMNPVDHLHGGGEGRALIGRKKPATPWGFPALGRRSRKRKKYSDSLILRRRTK